MKPRKRIFIPSRVRVRNTTVETFVDRWVWVEGRGITVYYKDGLTSKSGYKLRELLRAEHPYEIVEIN